MLGVSDVFVFYPERRLGAAFLIAALVVFSVLGVGGALRISHSDVGLSFLTAAVPIMAAVITIPLLVYRLYSLWGASYTLERDGVRLQWGLRSEVIPVNKIAWVLPASEVDDNFYLPRIRWPGTVLGVRRLTSGIPLEFMADSPSRLIIIAAEHQWFAVSPQFPDEFLSYFRRLNEMGSLSPLPAQSVYPGFLLWRFWQDRSARNLFVAAAVLNLLLLGWVSLIAPGRSQVALRLDASRAPVEFVSSVQLLLLPILSLSFFFVDWLLGLFFFRRDETRSLVYLFMSISILVVLLFGMAIVFIVQAT
jgi:hypothetical protein